MSTASEVAVPATLREALQSFQDGLSQQLPPAVHASLAAAIDSHIASHPAAHALKIGSTAPDFTLPDLRGQPLTLSKALVGPVVLTFYRGSWCPYCDLQLRAYSRMLPELTRLKARLIAVSPQRPPADGAGSSDYSSLGFPLLVDADNKVARQYGVVYSLDDAMRTVLKGFGLDLAAVNGTDRWELPVPATFVISSDARIRWVHVEADYRLRAEPEDILRAVKAFWV